jgi:hypothetical protein
MTVEEIIFHSLSETTSERGEHDGDDDDEGGSFDVFGWWW